MRAVKVGTFLMVLLLCPLVYGQNAGSTVFNGGSATWQWTETTDGQCPVGGNYQDMQTIYVYTLSNFNITVNGVQTAYPSYSTGYLVSPGSAPYCPASGPEGTLNFVAPNYLVEFTAGSGGQGSATMYAKGVIDPKVIVQSIIYDPPGNHSSNGFTNTETTGTTTGISSSFTQGDTLVTGGGFSWKNVGSSTVGWISGESQTTGNSETYTNTISQGSGVGVVANSSVNTPSHGQDLFVLWLNAAIDYEAVSNTEAQWTMETVPETASDPSPGVPEQEDAVEVTAGTMQAASASPTSVKPVFLDPQSLFDPKTQLFYKGAGLAGICQNVNETEYQAGKCTQADQCGCVGSDFTSVLQQDPLLENNDPSTYDPLDANTSPPQDCTVATSGADCRYVYVGTTMLNGPTCTGCIMPSNPVSLSDGNQDTWTSTQSESQTTGYSYGVSFAPGGIGPTINNQKTMTFANSESTGVVNGNYHTAAATIETNTVGCNEIPIVIYMDTVYHTFVFQEGPGTSGCP